jgi:hypothetical protein
LLIIALLVGLLFPSTIYPANKLHRVIQQALEAPNLKERYLAGVDFSGKQAIYLRDFLWDAVVKSIFKVA